MCVCSFVNTCWSRTSRKGPKIETRFQWSTYRKWHVGNRMATWSMTSRDPLWGRAALRAPGGGGGLFLVYATADEADAYMFYRCFFCFFSVFSASVTKIPDNRSRERLNGFFLPNDSGGNLVSNVVPKWGLGPQIILWGLKTTHCALGSDAWRVTEN